MNITTLVNVPVSVNIQTPQGTQARTAQRRDSGGGLTLDIIVEQITDAMSGDIVRGQGIAPVLERQYGLNRPIDEDQVSPSS